MYSYVLICTYSYVLTHMYKLLSLTAEPRDELSPPNGGAQRPERPAA